MPSKKQTMKAKLFNQYDIILEELEAGKYQLSEALPITKSDIWQHLSEEFALPLAYNDLLTDSFRLDKLIFYKDENPQKIELTIGVDEVALSIFQFSSIELTLNTNNNILVLKE